MASIPVHVIITLCLLGEVIELAHASTPNIHNNDPQILALMDSLGHSNSHTLHSRPKRFLWNTFFPLNWIPLPKRPTPPPKPCAIMNLCCKNQCDSDSPTIICNTNPDAPSNMFCQTSITSSVPQSSTLCRNVPETCPGCAIFPCTGTPRRCSPLRRLCPELPYLP